jgi:predicted ATPase
VVLRNYKSIAACDVSPAQLTFLVGPNGSGKSNFLDALRFVSDALRHSLDHALRDRGGINEVRRRSSGHPTHFGMRAEFDVGRATGHFAFTVAASQGGGYRLDEEECVVVPKSDEPAHYYRISSGEVKSSVPTFPAQSPRRLALVSASGLPAFRPVYDAFSRSGFYNLNPAAIRTMQSPDPGDLMHRDGSNVASVLDRIAQQSPEVKRMIEEYLGKVVPGVTGVNRKSVGPVETLEFRQRVTGAQHPWRFYASSMSDGTLRTVGLLAALFQTNGGGRVGRSLVGIEEPEVALHPAAAGVLVDALGDAAARKQILVTSHSADLLDEEGIDGVSVLAVVSDDGLTRIGPLDEVGASVLRDHLYTVGELLRMDKLEPDPDLSRPRIRQSDLFGGKNP